MTKKKRNLPVGVFEDINGTYYVKFKNKTRRGFSSKEEAEIQRAMMMLDLDGVKEKSVLVIKTVAEHFISNQYQRYAEEEITYGTYNKTEGVIRNYIIPMFGNYHLFKLTPIKLTNMRTSVFDLDLATATKNNILAKLKAVFTHAQKYFELDKDFTIYFDGFNKTKKELKAEQERLAYIWNDKDFELFLKEVEKDSHKIIFTLMFHHGLRIGEALAILWDRFDPEEMTIYIDGSITKKKKGGGVERTDPKTVSSIRTIYIGPRTTRILTDYKKQRSKVYGFKESWYLTATSEPLTPRQLDGVKDRALAATTLERIPHHDMRHMFVSNAWSKVPITAISKYIGHKDVYVTLKEYTHLANDDSLVMVDYITNKNDVIL